MANILVGIDFTPEGTNALYAATYAWRSLVESQLHIAHVVSSPDFATLGLSEMDSARNRDMFEQAQQELEQYVAAAVPELDSEVGHEGRRVVLHVSIGAPGEKLLELGRDLNVDHVYVGTKGRTGVARLILGSTAEQVVRHAGCPVHVVRAHDWGIPEIEPAPKSTEKKETHKARPPQRRWHYVPRNVRARENAPLVIPVQN